jgi:nucleoside-diphosphate-sugar epimerase
MRVFVTGGTGLIGSAVVAELLSNGHTVLALARSDASTLAVEAAGAETLRGGLADLHTLRAGTAQADGVIHLAFGNDFSGADALARGVAEESAAIATLSEALVGSDRPFVTVSGTPYVPGRVSTETDPLSTDGPVGGRGRAVMAALGLASRGVRSTAVRMPRTVHNEGTGGFAGMLTDIARRTSVSGYPGDGAQRWPAVHVLDAAVLFRLALELAPAGTSWHAVADEGDAAQQLPLPSELHPLYPPGLPAGPPPVLPWPSSRFLLWGGSPMSERTSPAVGVVATLLSRVVCAIGVTAGSVGSAIMAPVTAAAASLVKNICCLSLIRCTSPMWFGQSLTDSVGSRADPGPAGDDLAGHGQKRVLQSWNARRRAAARKEVRGRCRTGPAPFVGGRPGSPDNRIANGGSHDRAQLHHVLHCRQPAGRGLRGSERPEGLVDDRHPGRHGAGR